MAAEPGIPRELGPAPLAGAAAPAARPLGCVSAGPGALGWGRGGHSGEDAQAAPPPGHVPHSGEEPTGSRLLPPSRPRLPVPGSGV